MKRILSALFLLALPVAASAVSTTIPGTYADWAGVMTVVKTALWLIFGAVALVMFVIAGFEFITAAGDVEKLGKAKTAVIWGVVGIIVAVLAYSILSVIESII